MKLPVILVGKGPTAKHIQKTNNFKIAALNNSVILCERVDYLFINDMEALDLIPEAKWDVIHKVIIPTYPHSNWSPHRSITHQTLLDCIPKKIDYFVHRLDTCLDKDPSIPYLGKSFSVGTVALQYLGLEGYKEVLHCGIDSEGGYHPIFEKRDKNGKPINHQTRPEPRTTYVNNNNFFQDIGNKFDINLKKI